MKPEDKKNALDAQIQYKMIEKLSAMNQKLKEEIIERKKAEEKLEKTNKELGKALEAKSEFLSTMSHEIRTPLNIIIGYIQLLLKSQTVKNEWNKLETVKFAANSLLNIVDQILQYSRLDAGKLELEEEEVDLNDILSQFSNLFAEEAKDKLLKFNIITRSDIPNCLIGDVKKLHQILYNIVGNAFKFTEKGEVTLEVELVSKSNDICRIKFIVKDTGTGMTNDELKTIFERFRQVQTGISREYGGAGLGLAISRKLIVLMKGEIEVDSIKDVGSIFSIELPFKIIQKSQLQEDSTVQEGFEKSLIDVRVLLAEDDFVNQELAVIILKDFGCEVITVGNGKEAIEVAEKQKFDVILMDLHMPVINGFEAARIIKTAGNKTPILGFTADIHKASAKKIKEAGMQAVILKPFTFDELEKAITIAVSDKSCG